MAHRHTVKSRLWHVRTMQWCWVVRQMPQPEFYVVETAVGERMLAHEAVLADNIGTQAPELFDNVCRGEAADAAMKHWMLSRAQQAVKRFERDACFNRGEQEGRA